MRVWISSPVVLLTSLLLLAGCSSGPERGGYSSAPPLKPAPIQTPPSAQQPAQKPPPVRAVAQEPPASGEYVVQRGDTVYAIGRKFGLPPKEIIRLNNLPPPHHLEVGQRLRLPVARTHTVARGDTVYGVSRRYGVDMSELTRINRIGPPYSISVGQLLTLPAQTRTPVVTASRAQQAKKATPSRTRVEKPPVPPPPPLTGNGFTWPAKGRVISRFGPKQGGRHNDGINIRLPRGAEIRAAEAGTVVYAGNELRGFGNLVLVRHSGGWVSAYGHAEQVKVTRGQKVSRGQVIATVGSSGSVTEPQLHFELRKGTRAVDPQKYLPPA
ncbi:MAG: peptidoglycan DD-metalloendopeptidase family protein [Alphaproteobacteria bacterium]